MTHSHFCLLAAVLSALLMGSTAYADITIETVMVGNPMNAADTSDGDIWTSGIQRYGQVVYFYNIGKYEVTASQYMVFLNSVAKIDDYALYNPNMSRMDYGCGITRIGDGTIDNPYTYTVDNAFANRPVNYVSFGDAIRFANWLHNGQPSGSQDDSTTEDGAYLLNGAVSNESLLAVTRKTSWEWAVTSEDEWYKAAYFNSDSGSYYLYPTSHDSIPGRDLADASGNNVNIGGIPYPIETPYYTTQVGEFENTISPFGTHDQGGNVWEWTEGVFPSSYRALRGGSFASSVDGMLSSYRDSGAPTGEGSLFGFRVSQVPEPTSMALLLFGGTAILIWRRGTGY